MNYLYLYSVFIFSPDLAEIGNPHPGARSARRAIICNINLFIMLLYMSAVYTNFFGNLNEFLKAGD